MIRYKNMLGLCCAVALAMSAGLTGCSRQQSDWQKTRETNTTDAYEQFLKKYPTGEFTAQAQARVKEQYEERDWQKARDADTPEAYQAFLKEYPEGKWTEEARIRVENFTLAQAPSGSAAPSNGTDAGAAPAGVATVGAAPGGDTSAPNAPPAATTPAVSAKKGPASAPADDPTTVSGNAAAASPSATKSGKSGSGTYGIQLGAFKSGVGAAHARWAHLQKEYPSLLGGLSSKVAPKKTATGTLYRLRATGLTEKHALAICRTLKAKSQACVVVSPASSRA